MSLPHGRAPQGVDQGDVAGLIIPLHELGRKNRPPRFIMDGSSMTCRDWKTEYPSFFDWPCGLGKIPGYKMPEVSCTSQKPPNEAGELWSQHTSRPNVEACPMLVGPLHLSYRFSVMADQLIAP